MTAKECIKQRRSIRKFTDEPVAHDLLEELIETASYSPSWKNTQVPRYIGIENPLKDKIADECTSGYPPNGSIITSSAMLVAVTVMKGRCGFERDGSYSTEKGDGWQMFDAGIAVQSFCLAAHEKGLGTVILGIFDSNSVSSMLSLPEDQELITLISLGYPAESPQAPRRKPVSDLLSYQS